MGKYSILLSLLLASNTSAQQQRPPPGALSGKKISKPIRFLSPLQSLTLFPKDLEKSASTRRDDFLPKFKAALGAEKVARQHLARARARDTDDYSNISTSEGWEKRSREMEKLREEKEEEFVDRAVDREIERLPAASSQELGNEKLSKFQFVGVVQPSTSEKKVMWYARKRPLNSKWNIRLLHVNREAIVQDLFTRGKVDIYGEYVNKPHQTIETAEDDEATSTSMGRKLESLYSVKERSWKYVITCICQSFTVNKILTVSFLFSS